jgi:hypothetical protein
MKWLGFIFDLIIASILAILLTIISIPTFIYYLVQGRIRKEKGLLESGKILPPDNFVDLENKEFKNIILYLNHKAIELDGHVEWFTNPSGLVMFKASFKNTESIIEFEKIIQGIGMNGLPTEVDSDIENILTEIEKKKEK